MPPCGLMSAGGFLVTDSPRDILEGFREEIFEATPSDLFAARKALENRTGVRRSYPSGEVLKIACDPGMTPGALSRVLEEAGLPVKEVEQVRPTFEDVFLSMEDRSS